jgi:hypothetical protein
MKIDSTVCHLGIGVDDAIEVAGKNRHPERTARERSLLPRIADVIGD